MLHVHKTLSIYMISFTSTVVMPQYSSVQGDSYRCTNATFICESTISERISKTCHIPLRNAVRNSPFEQQSVTLQFWYFPIKIQLTTCRELQAVSNIKQDTTHL